MLLPWKRMSSCRLLVTDGCIGRSSETPWPRFHPECAADFAPLSLHLKISKHANLWFNTYNIIYTQYDLTELLMDLEKMMFEDYLVLALGTMNNIEQHEQH